MPRLEKVTFGASIRMDGWRNREPLENSIVSILVANRQGWKTINCNAPVALGSQGLDALIQHASTLEHVSIGKVYDIPRVLEILKSCPKLRRFADLDDIRYCHKPVPIVRLTEFVDF